MESDEVGCLSGQFVEIYQICFSCLGLQKRLFHGILNSVLFQVFICGYYPHWLFMTQRGSLRIHPMGIDGAITCFAPFHNVNCPKGFLYFNKQGELRISVLPTHLTYDAPWPIRKVPLRCTPHFVAYHVDSKVRTRTGSP